MLDLRRVSPLLGIGIGLCSASLSAQAHWSRLYPPQAPSARMTHAMAFDELRGATVLFGGHPQATSAETWSFDGGTWSLVALVTPLDRTGHAMVYDAARGVVVLFGGNNAFLGNLQETWEWDGTAWSARPVVNMPPSRRGHAMAYDRDRQRTVMFGGFGASTLDDTWEWDGVSWVQRSPALHPGPRGLAAMAYDPTLGGVLLFGGNSLPGFDETWSFDGQTWQQRLPANPPFGRSGAAMVADLARRRVVLWGGIPADPYAWEWDGTNWELRVLASPTARPYAAMAYDTARRQAVMFGGGTSSLFADTWIYGTDQPAEFETIGAGCPGTVGTAELTNEPYSLPWIGDTFTTTVAPLPAGAVTFFATGFEAPSPTVLAPFGMPGCALFVTVLETRLEIASPAGRAQWSLSIPYTVGLAGVEIAQQCAALDPGANATGLVMSSAGRFTLGIR